MVASVGSQIRGSAPPGVVGVKCCAIRLPTNERPADNVRAMLLVRPPAKPTDACRALLTRLGRLPANDTAAENALLVCFARPPEKLRLAARAMRCVRAEANDPANDSAAVIAVLLIALVTAPANDKPAVKVLLVARATLPAKLNPAERLLLVCFVSEPPNDKEAVSATRCVRAEVNVPAKDYAAVIAVLLIAVFTEPANDRLPVNAFLTTARVRLPAKLNPAVRLLLVSFVNDPLKDSEAVNATS